MKLFTWRNFLRVTLWGGATAVALGVVGVIAAMVYVVRVTEELPEYQQLAEYEPPIMSRVHAGDGRLIQEYAEQHRVFVPIENMPQDLIHAFVSAEDKNFYEHGGLDLRGIVRAAFANIFHVVRGERLEGASTITQQVAKNFLLSSVQRVERKVQEMVLARRIERAFTKDEILELYLNEIYFGQRAYGVAAAALRYFDKSLDELTLAESALLAAVINGPARFHPIRHPERTLNRRNWVLSRMAANGYITEEQASAAAEEDMVVAERLSGDEYLAAEYFTETVRRRVFDMYGRDGLYTGGLSIRTTLDTRMQLAARSALRAGLETYDRRHGYRGALGAIDPEAEFDREDDAETDLPDWALALDDFSAMTDLDAGWEKALVLDVDSARAVIGFADAGEAVIPLEELAWAREPLPEGELGDRIEAASDVLSVGDVIFAGPPTAEEPGENTRSLRQIPGIDGGILAMDPHTGRVLALVGGYSFQRSQFNRATQARRQPGSAFKPFVYAAALDNGYTPSSQVLDAPFVASGGDELRFYMPSNYSERYYGLSTLRLGLELSRNVMTVRLAQEMGMAPISRYGQRFGIYEELAPTLAMSLGAGETTLWRLAAAYSMLVNGGRRVEPTVLDRVQDRSGATIYAHSDQDCIECDVEEWNEDVFEPFLPDEREQVVSTVTAFQVVHMLEGAVRRGTGSALRGLGRPLAGKTGTTNDFRDAWFVGFSPDLVVGAYVGFDTPAGLGPSEAGGRVAAPIVGAFMDEALDNYAVAPFRVPDGVRFAPVNFRTGDPGFLGERDVILEAYHPGTEPSRRSPEEESGLSFGSSNLSAEEEAPELICEFLPLGEEGELIEVCREPDPLEEEEEEDLGGLY